MKNVPYALGALGILAFIVGFFAFMEWLLTIDWINWVLVPASFALIGCGFWGAIKLLRGDFNA